MSDFGSQPSTNRGRSRGVGGRYTPSPRGRSSRPSFQPNASPPVGYGWRPRGFTTSGHNVEPCSSEGEGSGETLADGISKNFASLSPLDNTYRHRGGFTPSGRTDESCSSEREGSAETLANGIKKFGSLSPVDNPYRHRGGFTPSGHNVERRSSERERSGDTLANGISKKFASLSPLDNPYRNDDSPQSKFSCVGNPMQVKHNSSIKQPFTSSASGFKQKDSPWSCPAVISCSPVAKTFLKNESIHAVNSGGFGKRLSEEINQSEQSSKEEANNGDKSKNLDVGFDICQERAGNLIKLKTPLHVKNKEKRNEIKRSMEVQNIKILCDGMVLLKSFISLLDQVKIVNTCRKLGIGPGGFYQPGYNDGAKLHLKMMCLGKNWDPETSQYSEKRPYDGAKPPVIPDELHHLVQKAIQHSQSYLEKHSKCKNIDVLPSMSPNICIVNFYTTSGKLGLHQDKDESPESIKRRLPVVSFSIGDAAEFLYSNERDPEKADKVILESGDVLIFGGKSRLIYHGVSSIKQNTASPSLLGETNLKPGRLNLTFRQY